MFWKAFLGVPLEFEKCCGKLCSDVSAKIMKGSKDEAICHVALVAQHAPLLYVNWKKVFLTKSILYFKIIV